MDDLTKMAMMIRAEERMGDAFTSACDGGLMLLDVLALKSNNKRFKQVAGILTAITALDHIRMIYVSLNARKTAINIVDEEDREEVKEFSNFRNVLRRASGNWKYQMTGKID